MAGSNDDELRHRQEFGEMAGELRAVVSEMRSELAANRAWRESHIVEHAEARGAMQRTAAILGAAFGLVSAGIGGIITWTAKN